MALLLQGFHQQTFGAFDSDPHDRTLTTQLLMKVVQARDVIDEPPLSNDTACRFQDAELMMGIAPVQPDEHTIRRGGGNLH